MISIRDVINDRKLNVKFLISYFIIFFVISISLPNFLAPSYKSESTVIINTCRDPDPLFITNLALCPEIFVQNEILLSESLLRAYAKHLKDESKIKFKDVNLSSAENLFRLYDLETQNLISQI